MENYYTVEQNAQMLIYLLKKNGIRKIVASPGTTNICFVYSVQQDDYFEVYSAPDERSGAYIACGLAAETKEAVVISCTGATASRNYIPGLTEAYYRELPVLAVTSTQPRDRFDNLSPQFIDRTSVPRDAVKLSVYIPSIHSREDRLNAEVNLNRAILELNHHGRGPVHINLETEYNRDYSVKTLPPTRVIERITASGMRPQIHKNSKIGIFVGAHLKWTDELTRAVDRFCECYNAVVLCDWTSNYTGKYGVYASLITYQENSRGFEFFDLLIDMGRVSGAYMRLRPREVWRIDINGKIEDRFRTLTKVFEMEEEAFFEGYVKDHDSGETLLYRSFHHEYVRLYSQIGELPFSNIWTAKELVKRLPHTSEVHLGILNTLRSWNFFTNDHKIPGFSNTGGFGIDGCLSSLIGASFAAPKKLYFGVIGDLAFFYDMNALGNRHIGNNIRLMIVSNGCGTEFKNYDHIAAQFGEAADANIAARGHYGNASKHLIKSYAESLGFRYIAANNKEEFLTNLEEFTDAAMTDWSIVFEVFTTPDDESNALKKIKQVNGPYRPPRDCLVGEEAQIYRSFLGEKIIFKPYAKFEKIRWQYCYPRSDKWIDFKNGKTQSLVRIMEENYKNIRVRFSYLNETGKETTSGETVIILE